MNVGTIQWLGNYLGKNRDAVSEYFTSKYVSSFLILWTIFEQELFNGYAKKRKLKHFRLDGFQFDDKLNKCFEYFHDRYQDKKKFNNLRHRDSFSEIDLILNTQKDRVNEENRLLLLLYVVYRYRNNIFHGSKGVQSWLSYKKEIELCVDIMKILIDNRRYLSKL